MTAGNALGASEKRRGAFVGGTQRNEWVHESEKEAAGIMLCIPANWPQNANRRRDGGFLGAGCAVAQPEKFEVCKSIIALPGFGRCPPVGQENQA